MFIFTRIFIAIPSFLLSPAIMSSHLHDSTLSSVLKDCIWGDPDRQSVTWQSLLPVFYLLKSPRFACVSLLQFEPKLAFFLLCFYAFLKSFVFYLPSYYAKRPSDQLRTDCSFICLFNSRSNHIHSSFTGHQSVLLIHTYRVAPHSFTTFISPSSFIHWSSKRSTSFNTVHLLFILGSLSLSTKRKRILQTFNLCFISFFLLIHFSFYGYSSKIFYFSLLPKQFVTNPFISHLFHFLILLKNKNQNFFSPKTCSKYWKVDGRKARRLSSFYDEIRVLRRLHLGRPSSF